MDKDDVNLFCDSVENMSKGISFHAQSLLCESHLTFHPTVSLLTQSYWKCQS